MKKIVCLLLALFIQFSLVYSADAIGFTHPEIGELIEFTYQEELPSFSIYGFTQYMLVPSAHNYRGISANFADPFDKNQMSFEESMELFFSSIEGLGNESAPIVFEYTGIADDYSYALNDLSISERVKAIKLLSGFNGPDHYGDLLSIPGFEAIDTIGLVNNHMDYSVEIDGTSYPYRVLMFFIEEDDWEEVYFERYTYILVKNEWKLFRVSKEYFSDYRQRTSFIQGFDSNMTDDLVPALTELMSSTTWQTAIDEVAQIAGSELGTDTVRVSDQSIYRLPADLTYSFDGEWLSSLKFTLKNHQSYYSAFVSLYIRFYDPISIDEDGTISWSLPDTHIQLVPNDEAPFILITPRVDLSESAAG